MGATRGVDLILVSFQALGQEEQAESLQLMHEHHLQLVVEQEGEEAQLIQSLKRAAEHTGADPLGVNDYRRAAKELRKQEEELSPLSRQVRRWGSWRQAREALQLSGYSAARAIVARFAKGRLDKIWRYTEASLAGAMARCVADLGHVPQVAEYEHWRARELELARAQGDDGFIFRAMGRSGGGSEAAGRRHCFDSATPLMRPLNGSHGSRPSTAPGLDLTAPVDVG